MAQVESRKRATSSEEARRAVLRRIEEEGVEFALLWFTDIEGHLKSFAITPSEIEDALDDGMGFDGSSISGHRGGSPAAPAAARSRTTSRMRPTSAKPRRP